MSVVDYSAKRDPKVGPKKVLPEQKKNRSTVFSVLLILPFVIFVTLIMTNATGPAYTAASPDVTVETNWNLLGLVLTGILAFGGVVWFGISKLDRITRIVAKIMGWFKQFINFPKQSEKTNKQQKRKRVTRNQKLERWNILREWYTNTLYKITQYETDIYFAIKYPAMNDPLEPATATMLQALEEADYAMKPIPEKGIGGDNETYKLVSDKVSAFSATVAQAEANAKKVALNNVSDEDRRDFRQAELLLKHVTDNGNTPETRANLANKLKQVIERINERNSLHLVPDTIIAEIEQRVRLALEAPVVDKDEYATS